MLFHFITSVDIIPNTFTVVYDAGGISKDWTRIVTGTSA